MWAYTYHRLFCDVHQVLQIIILMLLKSWKQHVQNVLFISSGSFSIFFLFPFIFNLCEKSKNPEGISSMCSLWNTGTLFFPPLLDFKLQDSRSESGGSVPAAFTTPRAPQTCKARGRLMPTCRPFPLFPKALGNVFISSPKAHLYRNHIMWITKSICNSLFLITQNTVKEFICSMPFGR